MNFVYLSIIKKIRVMKKENILDLINVLLEDYAYYKSIGALEAAEECGDEIEKYIDKIMAD
jgi:hypothetical protein